MISPNQSQFSDLYDQFQNDNIIGINTIGIKGRSDTELEAGEQPCERRGGGDESQVEAEKSIIVITSYMIAEQNRLPYHSVSMPYITLAVHKLIMIPAQNPLRLHPSSYMFLLLSRYS